MPPEEYEKESEEMIRKNETEKPFQNATVYSSPA